MTAAEPNGPNPGKYRPLDLFSQLDARRTRFDWVLRGVVFTSMVLVWYLSTHVDLFERIYDFTRAHDGLDLDEILPALSFGSFALLGLVARQWWRQARLTREALATSRELQRALDQIRELHEALPICSYCRKVRSDAGDWERIEEYLLRHDIATFSHGICEDCQRKEFPDFPPS